MLVPTIQKAVSPQGWCAYHIFVQSPTGREYDLHLFPERTILTVSTAPYKSYKEYDGGAEDTMAIIRTVKMSKEVRKCFLDVLSRSDWL